MANEKIRIDADLRAFKKLERKAQEITKPIRGAMNAAASMIRRNTQKRIRATLGGIKGKIIAEGVRYKTDKKTLRTIVYVRWLTVWFNHGTGQRSTRAGLNRGVFPYRYGWLYDAVTQLEGKIKEILFNKDIIL